MGIMPERESELHVESEAETEGGDWVRDKGSCVEAEDEGGGKGDHPACLRLAMRCRKPTPPLLLLPGLTQVSGGVDG